MWAALTPLIGVLLSKMLNVWWARKDQTDAANWRVYELMQPANTAAGKWKNDAWSDPARASVLSVLPGAQGLRLDNTNSPTSGGPGAGGVPPR